MSLAVRSLVGEWLRFFAVNMAGLMVDLGVAFCLRWLGVNLFVAASVGFTVAAFLNYNLQSRWTFGARKPVTARDLAVFYFLALVTISARLAILGALLTTRLPTLFDRELELLILASCASLVINYILCKLIIFRSPSPGL